MSVIKLDMVTYTGIRYKLDLSLEYGHNPFKFNALFDTGSPYILTLSQYDASKMQIPFKNLPKGKIISLGSLKYQSYILKNKHVIMKDNENKLIRFNIPEIPILISTKKGQKALNEAYSMPSIIGLKFLEDNALSLHINGKVKTGYLQTN